MVLNEVARFLGWKYANLRRRERGEGGSGGEGRGGPEKHLGKGSRDGQFFDQGILVVNRQKKRQKNV